MPDDDPHPRARVCLLCTCGLPGSGKSTLARGIAERALASGDVSRVHVVTFDDVERDARVDAVAAGAWRAEYDKRKHMFYGTNTRDCYQDKTATLDLPPMQKVAHVTWVDAGTPWYAGACARNLAAATCTGVCWLAAMDGYMGMQQVEFKKKCTGFLSPAPVAGPGAGHLSIRAGPLTVQLGR